MGRYITTAMALVFGLILTQTGIAWAQGSDDVREKMKELNRQALADYKAGDFESARLGLLEAVGIGSKGGMGDSPLMARTYVHLGAVYVNGLKDSTKGRKALSSAVKIRSDINLTDATITPELDAAFAAVKKESGSGTPVPVPAAPPPPPPPAAPPKVEVKVEVPPPLPPPVVVAPTPPPKKAEPEPGSDEPDLPATIPQPLFCPNPDEAPPREAIVLRCVVQPGVKVARVMLYYRVVGGEKFASVKTVKSPRGWYNGVIPDKAVSLGVMHYYLEARDPSDQIAGANGRSESPNMMIVRAGAEPVGKGALATMRKQRKAGGGTDEDPLAGVAEEQEREVREANDNRRRPGKIFLAFAVGLGQGYQPKANRELEFYGTAYTDRKAQTTMDPLTADAAWLPAGIFNILPEVGYQLNESWALSLQMRYQFIPQKGSGEIRPGAPATGAMLLLARAQYVIVDGNFQVIASGVLGAGDGFRMTLDPNPERKQRLNDTVRGGPLVLGPGIGALFHLNTHIALAFDVRLLAGFPDPGYLIDTGLGVQFSF